MNDENTTVMNPLHPLQIMDVLTFSSVVERSFIAEILHGDNNVYSTPHTRTHITTISQTRTYRLHAYFINKDLFSFRNSGLHHLSRLEKGMPCVSGDIIMCKKKKKLIK